ncbi:MAG: sulfatase-like hydrolase/transferase, partial [Bacteroidota bacterium]
YTEHAVDFIQRNKENPFLLYVPHSMPHVPLFASEDFRGKSGLGLYGDVMLEIDWSVQQINQTLKDNGLEDNTVIILTSDNGPWISYGNHAGETPFREAKGTSFDGGIRSACIIKYPPNIKAGSTSERAFFTIDLLPSLAHLAGVKLPEQEIDGHNLWRYIWGHPKEKNTHDYYAFSNGSQFQGVMSGSGHWKLHLPHNYRTLDTDGGDGMPGKYRQEKIDTALYHLHVDPMESENLWERVPTMGKQLLDYAIEHKELFYSEN